MPWPGEGRLPGRLRGGQHGGWGGRFLGVGRQADAGLSVARDRRIMPAFWDAFGATVSPEHPMSAEVRSRQRAAGPHSGTAQRRTAEMTLRQQQE